jgi:hypothetical protein
MSLVGVCVARIIIVALAAVLALEMENALPEFLQLICIDFATVSIGYFQQCG